MTPSMTCCPPADRGSAPLREEVEDIVLEYLRAELPEAVLKLVEQALRGGSHG